MSGVRCPKCGHDQSQVVDSRPREDEEKIYRRRKCLSCHSAFTTSETVLSQVQIDRNELHAQTQKVLKAIRTLVGDA